MIRPKADRLFDRFRVEFVTMSGDAFAAEFDVGEMSPPPVELIATAPR